MTCRETADFSWKQEHISLSHLYSYKVTPSLQRVPHFRHKPTGASPWLDGRHNRPWIQGALGRSSLNGEKLGVLNIAGEVSTPHVSQDPFALVALIKTCCKQKDLTRGSCIHAHVLKLGLLTEDIYVGTALLGMYAKWGELAKAQDIFDELLAWEVATWNALMTGYAQHGLSYEALDCFAQMQVEGFLPDAVTFVCALKACGTIKLAKKGEAIHADVLRLGLLENNVVLSTALLDMYAKCGMLRKAQCVFKDLRAPDVAAWNALISGYSQHGLGLEAVSCFEQMQGTGLFPNALTFVSVLKACGSIGALEKGEEIHAEVRRQGLLRNNSVLVTAVVHMYAKCGALTKAQDVFDEFPKWDVASWNSLIAGYTQNNLGDEAVYHFGKMLLEDSISPNAVTFMCVLKACGSIGAAEKGEEIHAEVAKEGLLMKKIELGNALVDMYAKCGMLVEAQEVFDELPTWDAVSWNALITGYAQQGKAERVFKLLSKMEGEHAVPDVATFTVLLSACCHAGLVKEGQACFLNMSTAHDITPTVDHGACMVDLLSRAGHSDEAISMIGKVPSSDCLLQWLALLGACRKSMNVELGRWAFEHVVGLDEKYVRGYVHMSNMYVDAVMKEGSR